MPGHARTHCPCTESSEVLASVACDFSTANLWRSFAMTVIFQLFCVEDLQRLSEAQLTILRDTITDALNLKTNPPGRTADGAPALPLEVIDHTELPASAPPEVTVQVVKTGITPPLATS